MNFDLKYFPRAVEYLGKMPNGLDSYPDAGIKADVHEDLVREFTKRNQGPGDGFPKIIDDYMNGRYRGKWLPEVVGNTLVLMMRDACFSSDDAFLDWCCDNMATLFNKPMYRVMMHVFSTALVVMGAAKRWSSFHRGSELAVKPMRKSEGRYETSATLTYPPHLFSGLLAPQLGVTYLAALKANKAQDPQVIAKEKSETESIFFVNWLA